MDLRTCNLGWLFPSVEGATEEAAAARTPGVQQNDVRAYSEETEESSKDLARATLATAGNEHADLDRRLA